MWWVVVGADDNCDTDWCWIDVLLCQAWDLASSATAPTAAASSETAFRILEQSEFIQPGESERYELEGRGGVQRSGDELEKGVNSGAI